MDSPSFRIEGVWNNFASNIFIKFDVCQNLATLMPTVQLGHIIHHSDRLPCHMMGLRNSSPTNITGLAPWRFRIIRTFATLRFVASQNTPAPGRDG